MSSEIQPGVRYRMPTVFGPAPGPRQKVGGRPWTLAETGMMNADWLTVSYRSDQQALTALLPPGFALRGAPVVHVSMAFFRNLYWLAGRGYGILKVDLPVTYVGKAETIHGNFCPVMWEGMADAILTGREELGFPKLFSDIPELRLDLERGTASGEASWLGFQFAELSLQGLEACDAAAGADQVGPSAINLYHRYMPRTGPGGTGGTDVDYVTTSLPSPGAPAPVVKAGPSEVLRWKGSSGSVKWHRASFEQLPTTFHIVNALAALPMHEVVAVEMIRFSAPGLAVSADTTRPVEAA